MTDNAQENDIYQDKDGNIWFVTLRTVKPVIHMEQIPLPGQRVQKTPVRIGELGSRIWDGFHKIGRKMGKREKTEPVGTEKKDKPKASLGTD